MNIGIYDVDATDLTIKERLTIYKQVGFSHVGFYFDDNYLKDGEKYLDIIEFAKEIGLKISQVHLDYKNSNMLSLDEDNIYLSYLESKVDEAIKCNVSQLVVHASKGNEPPLISNYSIARLKGLEEKLVEHDIYLCFENVRNNDNLDTLMKENIEHICVCYDSGHAHCYCNELEFIEKYKSKIITTHIHDNFSEDSHDLVGKGSIDWNKIFKALKATNRQFDYLECFPKRGKTLDKDEFTSFVREAYQSYKDNIENKK